MTFFQGSEVAQKSPLPTVPQCGACGLHKGCHSPKMPVSGKGKRSILIVAEAPGEEEDKQGIQLIGNSGKHLEATLRKFGVDMRRDCWLHNSLICRPPGNRSPTDKEIRYCHPNMKRERDAREPVVVIPIGKASLHSVLLGQWKESPGGIGRWAGWQIPFQPWNAWICPTFHPAYVLREKSPVVDRFFESDLRAAVAHDKRPWKKVPNYHSEVEVIKKPDKAAKLLKWFAKTGGTIAFDYETNMLKPEHPDAAIVSCSVCYRGTRTIAYPWHGPTVEATRALLTSKRVRCIASNMKFEDRWTRKVVGVRVREWAWDTMLAAHVLDNRPGITSIKFQALIHLGFPPYDDHIEKFLRSEKHKTVNRILKEVSLDDLLMYNGLDSLLEYKIAERQMEILK